MQLDDALFMLEVGAELPPVELLAALIACGVDAVAFSSTPPDESVTDMLHSEDAIVLAPWGDLVMSTGSADGILVSDGAGSLGTARAVVDEGLLGTRTALRDEALLALELDLDLLIYDAGVTGIADFALMRCGVPVYAGGLTSMADAEAITDAGLLRVCVPWSILEPGAEAESVRRVSRMLGRCV